MESDTWQEKIINKVLKSSEKQGSLFDEAIGEGFFMKEYQAI